MNTLRTTTMTCHACGGAREVVAPSHLREIRTVLGLSLREMGQKLGVSHAFVWDMERGSRLVPETIRRAYEDLIAG